MPVFGLMLCAALTLCFVSERDRDNRQNGLFAAVLGTIAAAWGCVMAAAAFSRASLIALSQGALLLANLLGYAIAAMFTRYLAGTIDINLKRMFCFSRTVNGLGVVFAILLVARSASGWLGFAGVNGAYPPVLLYPALTLLADIVALLLHRRALGRRDTEALLCCAALPLVGVLSQMAFPDIALALPSATASALILYVMLHAEQTNRRLKRELDLSQRKTKVMLSQIQPHFLYNALSVIVYFCDENPAEAKETTLAFTNYLRYNLRSLKRTESVPFSEELAHVRQYLFLEKHRFRDQLQFEYDIRTERFSIPPLSLQPLVENAVRHGLCMAQMGGTVKISTRELADGFEVRIWDDGVGFDADDPGLLPAEGGISNVRRRLSEQCGGTLEIESCPGKGTSVTVMIPKGE